MSYQVPFRGLSFRHIFRDAQNPSWLATFVTCGNNFTSTHPPPPPVPMPHPALTVDNFLFRKIRIIAIEMPAEVARVRVALEETKTLANDVRGIVPQKIGYSPTSTQQPPIAQVRNIGKDRQLLEENIKSQDIVRDAVTRSCFTVHHLRPVG